MVPTGSHAYDNKVPTYTCNELYYMMRTQVYTAAVCLNGCNRIVVHNHPGFKGFFYAAW